MYGLRRTVEPINPALPLELVRDHLRLYDGSQDGYLRDVLIPAATEAAELATHRQLITATWELVCDRFPCNGTPLYVPVPQLQQINEIEYLDAAGDEQTWDDELYTYAIEKEPAEVWPAFGQVWPATRQEQGAVRLQFVTGYGDTWQSVPALLRNGILLLVGHLYMNRQSVVTGTIASELPMTSREIFGRFAVGDDYTQYDPAR